MSRANTLSHLFEADAGETRPTSNLEAAVDMSGRKALIKKLVERGTRLVIDSGQWQGETTIATRHTVYRMHDGVCVAVHRQDTGSSRMDFVGMEMVGWLVDEDTAPAVSPAWRPGASAILVRPGSFSESLALTSPTIQFKRNDPMKTSHVRAIAPPPRYVQADSMTRIGIPRRGG